jgi:putative SOS response-associated peptidase YedK
MYRRYYKRFDKQRIAWAFYLSQLPEHIVPPPDFNVEPTTTQPVIRLNRDSGERELVMMRWGLIPTFAKRAEDFEGSSTFDVKAEAITDRAMWRGPFDSGAAWCRRMGSTSRRSWTRK